MSIYSHYPLMAYCQWTKRAFSLNSPIWDFLCRATKRRLSDSTSILMSGNMQAVLSLACGKINE